MGEAQQADADEQQEEEAHEPQENAFYPDHDADPCKESSRSGQKKRKKRICAWLPGHSSGPSAKCSRSGLSSSEMPTARSSLT